MFSDAGSTPAASTSLRLREAPSENCHGVAIRRRRAILLDKCKHNTILEALTCCELNYRLIVMKEGRFKMIRVWCCRSTHLIQLLFIITIGTAEAMPPDSLAGTVVNIAHRGGIVEGYPENTLAAFRHAITSGAAIIEIDLRGTKDGEVVIMHDETLNRTTNGAGPVANYTLQELKKFDAGYGEQIPTYEEVLELVSNTGVKLLLDIKIDFKLDKQKVVRLTEEHGAVSDIIVGVRNLDDLKEFRTLDPNIRTLGFIATPFEIEKYVTAGVDIIRLWSWWIFLYPKLVTKVQQLGAPVWASAGDKPRQDLERLIMRGVNGIITNWPEVMAGLLDDMESSRNNRTKFPGLQVTEQ
jgi:glycerophosphoryl diester phosphodiesterase